MTMRDCEEEGEPLKEVGGAEVTPTYTLNLVEKLSEKGSERRSEGGFGRYEEGEMGRKGPPWRSVGLRHRRLRGFSDSFRRCILRTSPLRRSRKFATAKQRISNRIKIRCLGDVSARRVRYSASHYYDGSHYY
jgi:hypothetical protein